MRLENIKNRFGSIKNLFSEDIHPMMQSTLDDETKDYDVTKKKGGKRRKKKTRKKKRKKKRRKKKKTRK